MSDPVSQGAGIPRPVRILNVQDATPVIVRFLGDYTGTILHWHGGRYHPCQETACPLNVHRASRSPWRAWAPVELYEDSSSLWWPQVLEITEAFEEQLHGRKLRGELWAVSRIKGKGSAGKVEGIFLEKVEPYGLRIPFNVLPVLQRVYHTDAFHLGKANPIPPKLILEASEGDAPGILSELAEPYASPPTPEQQRRFVAALKNAGRIPPKGTGTNGDVERNGVNHG